VLLQVYLKICTSGCVSKMLVTMMGRNTPAPLEELTTLFLTRVFDKVELLTQLGRGIPAGSSVYFSTKKESFVKVRKFSP